MMKPEEQLTSGVVWMLLQLEGALPTQTEFKFHLYFYVCKIWQMEMFTQEFAVHGFKQMNSSV